MNRALVLAVLLILGPTLLVAQQRSTVAHPNLYCLHHQAAAYMKVQIGEEGKTLKSKALGLFGDLPHYTAYTSASFVKVVGAYTFFQTSMNNQGQQETYIVKFDGTDLVVATTNISPEKPNPVSINHQRYSCQTKKFD